MDELMMYEYLNRRGMGGMSEILPFLFAYIISILFVLAK